jgi:hypothetical protein
MSHQHLANINQIFFIQSFIDGHLGCFYTLAIVNGAAVNIGVQVSFQHSDSNYWDIYQELELLGQIVILFLIF